MAISRCFMFMYFLLHLLGTGHMAQPSTDRNRAELPSGKLPNARVRRICRSSRSMTLLVRIRVQYSLGKLQWVSVSSMLPFTFLAAPFSFMERGSSTTALVLYRADFYFLPGHVHRGYSFALARGVTENTFR